MLLRMIYDKLSNSEQNVVYMNSLSFVRKYALSVQNGTLSQFRKVNRSASWLLMDDIQLFQGKDKSIEELLNTFEHIMEQGGKTIFTLQDESPVTEYLGERLSSRLKCGLFLPLHQPEKPEFVKYFEYELIKKKCSVPIFNTAQRVLEELATHVGELCTAQKVLEQLIYFIEKEPNLSMINFTDFWANLEEDRLHKKTPGNIIRVVSEFSGITEGEILGNRRTPKIVEARHLAMYAVREICQISYYEIGRCFNKQHGAILQAFKGINAKMLMDTGLRERYAMISKVFMK